MVRHTEAANEEPSKTTRRTRADLEALAEYRRTDAVDDDRVYRLVDHGWVTIKNDLGQTAITADGDRLARVVDALSTDDDEADDFEWVVDIFGAGQFADDVCAARTRDDAVETYRLVLSAANLCDDARHRADTEDTEPDHDGLFAPHIAAVNLSRQAVDLTFEHGRTAAEFVDLWNGPVGESVAVRHAADPFRVSIGPL